MRGELDWHGYVLRCDCGSAAGWRLSTCEDAIGGHDVGDFADATCTRCHQATEHPLVYPGMVRALANHARGAVLAAEDAIRVLESIRWRPHGAHFQYPDDDPSLSLDEYLVRGVAVWLPWEEPEQQKFNARPLPDPWWPWRNWPELLAAAAGLPIPQPPPPNR